jgi:hypothetical protein
VDAFRRLDHAFADDPVTFLETGDVLADLDDLADPFVAGRYGIGDRDDVLAREQFVVRMADPDACASGS